MTANRTGTAGFRERKRLAGERPLEIWLAGETVAQLDTLKAKMRVSSRDVVIDMILRSYLAQQPAHADAAGEARTQ